MSSISFTPYTNAAGRIDQHLPHDTIEGPGEKTHWEMNDDAFKHNEPALNLGKITAFMDAVALNKEAATLSRGGYGPQTTKQLAALNQKVAKLNDRVESLVKGYQEPTPAEIKELPEGPLKEFAKAMSSLK